MIRRSAFSLLIRRARADAGFLCALSLVLLLVMLLVTGTVGWLGSASVTGLRAQWAAAPPADVALQLRTRVAEDPGVQDAAARAVFGGVFPASVDVWRSVRSRPVAVAVGDAPFAGGIVVASVPGIEDHARIVDGRWPSQTDTDTDTVPAALQADAADALEVVVGDLIDVGERGETVRVRLAATWRVADVSDPFWFGESIALAGVDEAAVGLLAVPEGAGRLIPGRQEVRWTIAPPAGSVRPGGLPAIGAAAESLRGRLDGAGTVERESLTIVGGLAATVDRSRRALDAAGAIGIAPIALVGSVGGIAFAHLAGALAARRRGATSVLLARGLSRPQLVVAAMMEAAAIALPATVIAVVGTSVVFGRPGSTDAAALAVGAVSILVFVAATAIGRQGTVPGRADDAASGWTRALRVAAVLTGVGAIVSLIRFAGGAASNGVIEPIAAVAPTLTLVTLAIVGALTVPAIASALLPLATRFRTLLPALPAWQVRRNPEIFSAATLTIILAIGTTAFSSAVAENWTTRSVDEAAASTGADVRVSFTGQQAADDVVSTTRYAEIPKVDAATPVLSSDAKVGASDVSFLAVDPVGLDQVTLAAPGALDALDTPPPGIAIPEAASAIRFTVETTADQALTADQAFSVWIVDDGGSTVRVPLVASAGGALEGRLPEGVRPWRAIAVESQRPTDFSTAASSIRIVAAAGVSADGSVDQIALERPADLALDVGVREGVVSIGAEPPARIPVLITTALADSVAAGVGDRITVTIAALGRATDAEVVGIVRSVPGVGSELAIAADLSTLGVAAVASMGSAPPANEAWLSTDAAPEVAAAASAIASTDARVTTTASESTTPTVAPAIGALQVGSAGVSMLAAITVLVLSLQLERSRRAEAVVLRALGATTAQQRSSRLLELAAVSAAAVILGLVAGTLVAILTSVGLVSAAVDGTRVAPPMLAFDAVPLIVGIGGLVAALVVISGAGALVLTRALRVARRLEDG